jgi:oligopeptide transport system substrate-binding protein
MLKHRLTFVLPALALTALALAPISTVGAAAIVNIDANITFTSPMLQSPEPVTVYGATTQQITTMDPQLTEDSTSVGPVENLFLGLTDIDPKTTSVRPEMATKWDVSADQTVWTYTLRDDVPWVRYDPASGQATEIRKVTAQDFVYGIHRACDPRTGGLYSKVAAAMIKGCDVTMKLPLADLNDAAFEQVAVKALSDTQLEITLRGALGYWQPASAMWIFRAVPREAIEEFGDRWIEPGNIITNGPFMLAQWDRTINRVYLKNPYYPDGVNDNYGGNVERIETIIIPDGGSIYSLYQNSEIDSAGVPDSELQRIRQDPEESKQLRQNSDLGVFYFGFMYDKPPFDNVHVRRAFSAAIDRQALVSEILQNRAVPMAHFTPPGIRGAAPINEVGIGQPNTPGFDPEYARAQLAEGGFPDCQGFPEITFAVSGGAILGEFLQGMMRTHLNCDPDKLIIEEIDGTVLLRTIEPDVPTQQRPHIFVLGWLPDYPDAHNWLHDVLGCNSQNNFKRPCNPEIDGMIDKAALSTDPAEREKLYRDAEEAFFGPNGDFPIAPLFLQINIYLVKPWFTYFYDTDGLFGGNHWNTYKIDQAAQLAARP